jgi:hypothetical protein
VFNFDGPTESDIIYDVNAVDYNVKAICSQVEDANTQNPWALPDNAGLETELTAMITSFLNAAGYPSDHFGAQVAPDADYWNLNFTVNKLTWGF